MHNNDNGFITFNASIEGYTLPKRFTFPFYYQPHPLCLLAVKELQHYLETQNEWQHDFGLLADNGSASGKMFGVLLVENHKQEIGYLTAFSGKLCNTYNLARFVPSVPDTNEIEALLETEQIIINQLTKQLKHLQATPQRHLLFSELQKTTKAFDNALRQYQILMADNRKTRKNKRQIAENSLTNEALSQAFILLAKESVHDKNQLKTLKNKWLAKIKNIEQQLNKLNNAIALVKNERQNRSSALQDKLFKQYQLLNKYRETQSLQQIFKPTSQQVPPAGAGDCAAPKLIQYAFKKNYHILAMTEFWWGKSPKSEIRQHKNFYPACLGKCEPILKWMLKGINQDDNPLLINTALTKPVDILYQDDALAIINKPHGLLSVPGKHIQDSVFNRIKQLIPTASGPVIVHRLDMSTSGLMVIALTKKAHKQLQKQFIQREVDKQYIALLEGIVKEKTGEITLPLIGDFYDRPRQYVCEKTGKPAHTFWQVIEYTSDNKTKIQLTPKTGRTHQLRVHCAHPLGLNTAIVGDDLYGTKANRLHLHAEKLTLKHPLTKEVMTFTVPAKF